MIYGIGCDIVKVSRFAKWVANSSLINRFFNKNEILTADSCSIQRKCEYYAVRFAAKESFSKALGTGLKGFELTDIYIEKDADGKPSLRITGNAAVELEKNCGKDARVHVSLSHEKEYAVAYVIIERG
ncbi:MAG: holo-ACP synthase [Treponema sp.]|nr:holo-ACP synthase [Treponema sp.]